jgi:amidohydrolase
VNVADATSGMLHDLVRLRRELHREPELGLHLPRTQERVLAALEGLPLEVSRGRSLSSVVALLRGGAGSGAAVLLRADMDALPLTEQTGLDFAAPSGRMHACGHDLHAAMLVGAARLLASQRDELAGDVVFMFQPGEEGYDGAQHMIDEGLLDAAGSPLLAAYGLHVVSAKLPHGVFATRPGPLLAGVDVLRVTVRGQGGHASLPHLARDPIPAACEMVLALQTMVTRRFDVFDPVVLTVGLFQAGTWPGVVPSSAHFEASVRSFSTESSARIREESVRLCEGVASAHGLDAEVEARTLCPVTVNDAREAEFTAAVIQEVFGEERFQLSPHPVPASEDFSRVLDAVPGAFLLLGACPPEMNPDTAPLNHSDTAVFDDSLLVDGAQTYAQLALKRLKLRSDDTLAPG